MQPDLRAYKAFKKLKEKYPTKMVRITEYDLTTMPHLQFKDHREYVAFKLKQEGVEVTRWQHDYASLDTHNPLLGVVFLGSDSVVDRAYEAHVLIGHNAKYVEATRDTV